MVTLDALAPFRSPAPAQDPPPLPYLRPPPARPLHNFDVRLEASLRPAGAQDATLARSSLSALYWALPQLVAHHTAGGCNLRPGDLLGTGTLSVGGAGGQGSLLELSWNGTRAVALGDGGGERRFLEDGDRVTLRGYCQGEGYRVGFGECAGTVLPAWPPPAG